MGDYMSIILDGTNGISDVDGSASTPAIRGTDTNTGVFFPAADTIAFAEGGTEAMRIDSSGNVGIGTSSPTQRLDVVAANSQIHFGAATTGGGYLMSTADGQFRISGGAVYNGSNWIAKATTASIIGDDATGDIKFFTNTSLTSGNSFTPTERMRIDSSGNVGIGTASPDYRLQIEGPGTGVTSRIGITNTTTGSTLEVGSDSNGGFIATGGAYGTLFYTNGSERARITSGGDFLVGKTSDTGNTAGITLGPSGYVRAVRSNELGLLINRLSSDGTLVSFEQDTVAEGSISVSGSTVSYNGGNLSRWAQLTTPKDDTPLFKGTVMSNLDEMNVYIAPTTYWTEEDELPEGVNVGDVKVEEHAVDNEQLNKVKVSDVEGDVNVAGVFVNWSYDEAHQVDEINMAMTGDMIIRIAQGVVVQKGDLLMSAGDGTAKPQGDDIVRSKTVAKVTSNHVTCTYEDGSYCVPCVLMAC
jgi:hypothetical protein